MHCRLPGRWTRLMTQLQRLRLMQQVLELLWMLLGPATLTSFPGKTLLMRPARCLLKRQFKHCSLV